MTFFTDFTDVCVEGLQFGRLPLFYMRLTYRISFPLGLVGLRQNCPSH